MKCNYCDYKVREDAIYCPNCGEKVSTRKKNTIKEEKDQNEIVSQSKTTETESNSDVSFLWGILGYFVPIAGLILFIVWKDSKPKEAKAAGIGALIRFIILFIVFIIIMLMIFFSALTNI